MLLRSHIKERFARIHRQRPSSHSQDSVDRLSKTSATPPSLPTRLGSQQRASTARCPSKASHRAKKPLPSILKKPHFSLIRRSRFNPMSRKAVYYEVAPQRKKEVKKQVRFALPDKHASVRPAQSVSTHATEGKRSTTVHPRSEKRPSKRARYPEPVPVAPGLSTAARAREVERPKEMAKAKAKALDAQRRSSLPVVTAASKTSALPRREKHSYTVYGPKKLSTQLKPSVVVGDGYDWARVTRRTVYGWYK